jgi:hypothetical protein
MIAIAISVARFMRTSGIRCGRRSRNAIDARYTIGLGALAGSGWPCIKSSPLRVRALGGGAPDQGDQAIENHNPHSSRRIYARRAGPGSYRYVVSSWGGNLGGKRQPQDYQGLAPIVLYDQKVAIVEQTPLRPSADAPRRLAFRFNVFPALKGADFHYRRATFRPEQ